MQFIIITLFFLQVNQNYQPYNINSFHFYCPSIWNSKEKEIAKRRLPSGPDRKWCYQRARHSHADVSSDEQMISEARMPTYTQARGCSVGKAHHAHTGSWDYLIRLDSA